MPGICGVLAKGSAAERHELTRQMVECMLHEPFYSSGTYHEDIEQAAVGWVVQQGTYSDCNPIWNETKDICLFFSGEHFAETGDLSGLKERGHRFVPENASSLVHLYEETGLNFLKSLNGSFAGLLIDHRQKLTILFNDRYGLSRVYFSQHEDGIYFSSEAKSLLRVLPQTRQLEPRALAEYAACGCALENRTLFSGIHLLPPASVWIFGKGKIQAKRHYFDKSEWEQQSPLSQDEYYEKLRETFIRILPKYFRSSQPVGMSLTGGLDGRMIMAWSGRAPGTLPCYTFGSTYRDCTDVTYARRVAEVSRQPYQIIPVDESMLTQFDELAKKAIFLSDGAMDVTGAVELFANRQARRIAPVRMTGNYGSEILRGNIAFKPQPLSPLVYSPEFLKLGDTAARTFAELEEANRISFIAFKQVPWHHHSRLSLEQSQLTMRSPYLDNEIVALAYQIPSEIGFSKIPALRLIAEGNGKLGSIPTDRGVLYRPIPVLTRVRNVFQEFTFRAEYAYDYGMPQWLARVDGFFNRLHLEKMFLGRHKFYHFRVWYRDQLGKYLREILLDPRTLSRSILNSSKLENLVDKHCAGVNNFTTELHQALSIELIHRELIERN
jgi:asparagine synthase (glutamine-hydrolysing)